MEIHAAYGIIVHAQYCSALFIMRENVSNAVGWLWEALGPSFVTSKMRANSLNIQSCSGMKNAWQFFILPLAFVD